MRSSNIKLRVLEVWILLKVPIWISAESLKLIAEIMVSCAKFVFYLVSVVGVVRPWDEHEGAE